MRLVLLGLVIWAALCGNAAAWGDDGHRIVCEIAFRLAQPDTRVAVRKLIKSGTEFDNFSDSCIFPDHPRIHPPRHFLNLPRDAKELGPDDCAGASECVVRAIIDDAKNVASKTANTADRLIALMSLGHWVGDIHQPLHVSFADDRGGNDIGVSGACSRNLHAAWDNCLVMHAVGKDVKAAADALMDAMTLQQISDWSASDPQEWANESFAIAEAVTTGYCSMRGESCEPPASGSLTIDNSYFGANNPVVKAQLQKAGVRLAHLLDSAFSR